METQALQWEQLPMQWNEGAFLGNGRIGMMVYVDSVDNSLTLWLGRPDVTDHRLAPDRKTSLGIKGASVMTDYCRMDVGKMKLYPEAKILSGTMRLDIYDATLTGVLHTEQGDISLTAFTPYDMEVNVVDIKTSVPYVWKLHPGSPSSPRIQVFPILKKRWGMKTTRRHNRLLADTRAGVCIRCSLVAIMQLIGRKFLPVADRLCSFRQ